MSNQVYSYGAQAPECHLTDIEERLYQGNRYYNVLVEIELGRRTNNDAVLQKYDAKLPEMMGRSESLNKAIQEAEDAVKKANQDEGRKKRKSPAAALRKERTALNKEIRSRKKMLRNVDYGPEIIALVESYKKLTVGPRSKQRLAMKAEIQQAKMGYEGYAADLVRNDAASEAAKKALYNKSPLFWSHKNCITEGFKDACKKHPKFHRYDGHGVLYTQIQGGMTHIEVLEKNQWFYITGSGRKRYAWIRIDSNRRSPIFTVVPFVMHRKLPVGAIIKGVSLVRKRCATKTQWEIQISLSGSFETDATGNDLAVGIDLGWRRVEDHSIRGRKVAHIIGEDGYENVLILPQTFLDRWQQVEDLQSIRDNKFNSVMLTLRDWLKTHDIPEWLSEATRHIHCWKSQQRLARLVYQWRKNRFIGDETINHLLDGSPADSRARKHDIKHWNGWRCWDKHLYEWQENLRQKAVRWRLDLYRKFAAQLSRRYGVLLMEDVDWSKTIRRSNAEDVSNDTIKAGQRIASPGLLRELLENRFTHSERVEAAGTTSNCHVCGKWCDVGAGDTLRCACGNIINRDANACYNILSRGKQVRQLRAA